MNNPLKIKSNVSHDEAENIIRQVLLFVTMVITDKREYIIYARSILVLSCLLISCSIRAQENKSAKDSIQNLVNKINRVYPSVRPYSIQIDRVGNRVYNAWFLKQKIENGDISETLRAKSFLTFPITKKNRLFLYGTFTHVYQKIALRNTENLSLHHPQFKTQRDIETHDLTLSINTVYRDSLFGKMVVYTSALMLNSRDFSSIEKFRARFTGSIILKSDKETVITAGVIALIDASASLPFTPLFTYWHRLPRQWQIDFILPSRLYLRHPLSSGWFSIGSELTTAHGFTTPDQSVLQGEYEYNNMLLQSGINLEYPISNKVLLGFRTGVESMLSARMIKLNGKNSDYVSKAKTDPSTYFSFSLAFVPGLKEK